MRTYIVAEAGVNHQGELSLARRLVDAAADAGADAVKFQAFTPAETAHADAPKAAYQREQTNPDESQRAMLEQLTLDAAALRDLRELCAERGVDLLVTAFDLSALRMLTDELGLAVVKLPSGELTHLALLVDAGRRCDRLILSTGMSDVDEVQAALAAVAFGRSGASGLPTTAELRAFATVEHREALAPHVTLLHCTSAYPTAAHEVNLRAMQTLRDEARLPVGLSDHTLGNAVSIAAVALGAVLIERHLTLDRALPGPDHAASLVPEELADLVRSVRDVEAALGDGQKRAQPSERDTLAVARKSLFARAPIQAGERFDEDNVVALRPSNGLSPMLLGDLVGRRAQRSYVAGHAIDAAELHGDENARDKAGSR